jgi:hypothetical protein
MPMPIVLLPPPDSAERSRLLAVDELRKQALERLYARRSAVDELIQSLENYQRSKGTPPGEYIELNNGLRCS